MQTETSGVASPRDPINGLISTKLIHSSPHIATEKFSHVMIRYCREFLTCTPHAAMPPLSTHSIS